MSAIHRVALAGFGAWGQMHARALAAIPEARLVSVYCHGPASDAAAAEQVPEARRFASYEAMLAAGGHDVVIVAVPNDRHAAFALAALAAGADVILEKPLGTTLAECDAVIAAAETCGRQVAVNHELRVSHQWAGVRDLVASGAVGRVRHQHLSLFRKPFRQGAGGWRYDRARVGSWTLEELVHFVDLVAWYARENGPPAEVTAWAAGGGDLASTSTANLAWADGSTALVNQCLAGFEHHTLLEIAGEDGAIRTWWSGTFDRTLAPSFALSVRRRGATEADAVPIQQSGEAFELVENLRRAFEGFRGAPPVTSLRDARAAVAACLAIDEAVVSGRTVPLPQP